MLAYSPLLTAVVWGCFLPVFFLAKPMQRRVSQAYAQVRERVGGVLSAVSESVVGAATIRAYAVERRTAERVDAAVAGAPGRRGRRPGAGRRQLLARRAGQRPGRASVVVVVGTWRGVHGHLTLGELLAFLFLVQLFTGPVQIGTEVLNEMQNAIAGWRRVLAVVDTPADVADPGEDGEVLPRGPITVRFDHVVVRLPGRARRCCTTSTSRSRPQSRIAVVGETGSGKTTFAKLLTRLMDPSTGCVQLDGVDLRQVRFSSLRERIVLVPQDGFLFDDTLLANARFARPDATREDVALAFTELGLAEWLEGLAHGLDTRVGQRGESLSAGERQLVALARAYLADPDLLVLDEATSAVDPATEVRIQRALDGADPGPDLDRHRAPAVHRGGGGRGARRRRRRGGRARAGRRAGPAAAASTPALHESWVSQQRLH